MIPWIVGGVLLGGYALYKVLSDDAPRPSKTYNLQPTPQRDDHAVLRGNVRRLRGTLESVSRRRIAVVGQPGAGKSTLVIELTRSRATPLPVVGAQTDATDWSTDPRANLESYHGQDLYVDFPGYGTRRHPVDVLLPSDLIGQLDVVLFVWRNKFLADDEKVLDLFGALSSARTDVIGIRSASDDADASSRGVIEQDWRRVRRRDWPIHFCSCRNLEGLDELRRRLGIL